LTEEVAYYSRLHHSLLSLLTVNFLLIGMSVLREYATDTYFASGPMWSETWKLASNSQPYFNCVFGVYVVRIYK